MKYDLGRYDLSSSEQHYEEIGTHWEASDGTIVNLQDPTSYQILWGTPTGWTGHMGNPETINLPDFSAERITRMKYQRRTPSLTIMVTAQNRQELDLKCDMLISAFNQELGLGRLHIVTTTREKVYIDCMVASGSPEIQHQSDCVAIANMALIAPDPRYYSETLVTIGANGTTINPGNASSPCIFTCSANTVSNTAHDNTITNASGQSLSGVQIDTTPGHLRAEKNSQNAMHMISMASDIAAFTVRPGYNKFTGVSTLSYRPAWRGKAV